MKKDNKNENIPSIDLWMKVISSFFQENNHFNEKNRPKCDYCMTENACWLNVVVKDYCCEDCVPRGCSCRLYLPEKRRHFSVENYIYQTDSNGNDLPCEDWVNF